MKGRRHGKGIFLYATGEIYDGEWEDNMKVCDSDHSRLTYLTIDKHGKATYTYENGRQFKGQFQMDRQVGPRQVYKTGKISEFGRQ
jgi:hypothetical protein